MTAPSADDVRATTARLIHRFAHRLDRIGWWVGEHPCDRRLRRKAKAATLAEELAAHSDDEGAE